MTWVAGGARFHNQQRVLELHGRTPPLFTASRSSRRGPSIVAAAHGGCLARVNLPVLRGACPLASGAGVAAACTAAACSVWPCLPTRRWSLATLFANTVGTLHDHESAPSQPRARCRRRRVRTRHLRLAAAAPQLCGRRRRQLHPQTPASAQRRYQHPRHVDGPLERLAPGTAGRNDHSPTPAFVPRLRPR
jgi:hypothetical protein